jgi:cellulose synthase/poly-beta-1,6-N-acetylglucosamine synthase-like glycosyltransferase
VLQLSLAILLFTATTVQLWFWGVRFFRLARYREPFPSEDGPPPPPVSVIICAHNEADHLRQHLPFFLAQDYPRYEVIVVDDHSTDETAQVVWSFQKKHPTLVLLKPEQVTPPGKKAALSWGIRNARFEWLVLSDADCRPAGPHWLQHIARQFQGGARLVLGASPYTWRRGWLNRFLRFEAFYTAIQYLSFALAGDPYMGVGRNLAYHRSVFRRAQGFRTHTHLMGGDDDLFVNQVAKDTPTRIVVHPDSLVYSDPVTTWRSYYYQKRRHLSVSRHYQPRHQWLLGALSLSHAAHYGLAVMLLVLAPHWWPFITMNYLVRMAVVFRAGAPLVRRLAVEDLLPWLPWLDLAYLAYYFLFAPALLTGSSTRQWK